MNTTFSRPLLIAALTGVLLGAGPTTQAAELYIYPAQGQDADQQGRDEYECYQFAKQNSGFDPMAAPTASGAPPPSSGSSAIGGAAKSAAVVGLTTRVVTGSSKDAKKAAQGGAVAGALIGGSRRNREERARNDYAQQEAANYENQRNNYNRAYSACLEGRGYTVR